MKSCISILVVDSDTNVGRSLALILEKSCISVTRADNACQTLEKLRNGHFDLVCLDIIHPDMDIITLLKRIEELQPQIPGLIITGYPSITNLMENLCPSKWSCFLKPVDPNLLLERINEMFALGKE